MALMPVAKCSFFAILPLACFIVRALERVAMRDVYRPWLGADLTKVSSRLEVNWPHQIDSYHNDTSGGFPINPPRDDDTGRPT